MYISGNNQISSKFLLCCTGAGNTPFTHLHRGNDPQRFLKLFQFCEIIGQSLHQAATKSLPGRVIPGVSVDLFDGLAFTLGVPYVYGEQGRELSPTGDSVSVELRVEMGGTSF